MPSAPVRAAEPEPAWLHARERGSTRLLRFMVWVTLRLGRGAGRFLLPPIVLYFVIFSPRSRAASRRYLARALGRRAGVRDVLRHYHAFAGTILDRVYFLSGRWDHFDVRLHGHAALREILECGRGCILLGSHLGSFEALRAAAVFEARWPFAMLMDNANAQKVARTFAALNPALAATIIESGAPDSLVRAKERLDAGAMLGMLGDRLRPGDRAIQVPFLGAPMRFPEGPFIAAEVLGAPVVLCFGLYRGGRRYDLHFEPFRDPLALRRGTHPAHRAEALAAGVRDYAARLEHYARLAPYNWFNFFDVWAGSQEPPSR
jgi:predicted LPLAT superfamily acyltransferase